MNDERFEWGCLGLNHNLSENEKYEKAKATLKIAKKGDGIGLRSYCIPNWTAIERLWMENVFAEANPSQDTRESYKVSDKKS